MESTWGEDQGTIDETLTQALLLLKADRLEEAEEAFLEVLLRQPKEVDAIVGLALVALKTQDYPQALVACEQGLKLDPGHVQLQLTHIGALLGTGRIQAAFNRASRLIREHPESQPGLMALQTSLASSGLTTEARHLARRCGFAGA